MGLPQRIINKIIRIVEGPPVRDRIVVKVMDNSNRITLEPCFLIGAYRSGTTLLRFILDSHSNIAVPPETNFLYELAGLWRSEWVKKGMQGIGVVDDVLRIRLRDFTLGIFNDYTLAKGKKRWIDKTPAYIDILDFLDFLFGDRCQYIMLYRHGLDVANSLANMYEKQVLGGPAKQYADSFNGNPCLTFTRYWVEQCEKMLAFEADHQAQCHRIYYEQFAMEPERYIPPLFEFLGETWQPEVLYFNQKQHDFGLQDSKIMETKSFTPKIGTYRLWSAEEIAAARELASDTMIKLGYEI
jgi:hypothetical protein